MIKGTRSSNLYGFEFSYRGAVHTFHVETGIIRLHTRRHVCDMHTTCACPCRACFVSNMYHTHLALYTSYVCFAKYDDDASKNFPTQVCTSPRYASIPVVSMSVLCLFSLKYEATTLLICAHAVSILLKIC